MNRPLTPRRWALTLAACLAVVILLLLLSPGVGTQRRTIGIGAGWHALLSGQTDSPEFRIAFQLRFPRALKALIAGATLALSGAVFQTLFRNPLAEPYTLGIASGAALGALIAHEAGWIGIVFGVSTVSITAFGGASAVLLAILLLARSSARITGNTLLLAGVTIGFFCAGLMMFLTYLADVTETYNIVRWMMGSLDTFMNTEIRAMLPLVIPAWLVLLTQARRLDQFEIGAEIAATRGVNVARLHLISIFAVSVGVAAVVSMCGPIGFVGLIIPHVARLFVGRGHRVLLPAAALLGGAFLIGCDFLTTIIPAWYGALAGRSTTAAQLPIGVMTALLGTPVFLIMLCWRLKPR
jgi:iron complex transport system permease protein